MPRWVVHRGDLVCVLADDDLVKAAPAIANAKRLWLADYRDGGSCAMGAGIAVLYLPPRCRSPRTEIIIEAPGQSDGADSVGRALAYLARYGVAAFHEAGRMD